MTIETKITNLRRTIELANQYWDELNLKAFECEDEVETDLIMEAMRSVQAYGKRCEQDLCKLLEQKQAAKKKVTAHLVNRIGVCIKGLGYNYVSVWPTMDSAMDEAYGLTNVRNLCANIIDREIGNILVQYENGKIIWRDKSTMPR